MSNHYQAAIDQAKEELASIQPALDSLLMRKDLLESVIISLGKMIPQPVIVQEPVPAASTSVDDVDTPSYLWQQLRDTMKWEGAWTLAEAGLRVERAFNIRLEPNRAQKVRNSVIRHPETFMRLQDGRYLVQAKDQGATEAAP